MDSLTIYWPYLTLAVVLLWLPRRWLRLGVRIEKVRRRRRDPIERFASGPAVDPDDKSVILAREFRSPRNYVDFFRGLGGAYALLHFSFALAPGARRTDLLPLYTGVLLAGALIQALRYEKSLTLFAPLFYLFGIGMAVTDLYAGAFAMLLVCAVNVMLPSTRAFLGLYGLLVAVFWVLFPARGWLVVAFVVMVWLPAVLSLLMKRPLLTYSHKIKL